MLYASQAKKAYLSYQKKEQKKSVIGAWDITNVAWSEKEYYLPSQARRKGRAAAANVKLPDDKCILSTFADV